MKAGVFNRLMMVFCCLLLPDVNLSAQNWSLKTPINPSIDFNGVFFTSDQTGYAVGTAGAIYKTIDGGLSWTTQTSGTSEVLHDVYFVNSNTGYAVGTNGAIRKTTNGGATWTSQTATGTATTVFYDLHFLSGNNGFIAGSGGKIIKTTDGGATWSTLTSGTSSDLHAVYFTSLTAGYVAGNGGIIRKTSDAGSSWTTLTIGTTQNLNDIYFLDATTGYTVGEDGQVWKTANASTWTNQSGGFSLTLNRVQFINSTTGYTSAVGGYSRTTYDGGANWYTNPNMISSDLQGLHFPSANAGYMVGTSGVLIKYQPELEPEYQPSSLAFTEVFSSSMRVSYTASPDIPTGYLVIRKTGSAPTSVPMDGIEHTLNQTLPDGSTVVYIGNSTSFNQSGLTPGNEYFYTLYSYNGSGLAINYKVASPLAGSQSTYTTGAPWTSMITETYHYPTDAHFFDANTGGIAGGYQKRTTTNGGQVWTTGGADGDSYTGIFFASQTTAYAVGSNGSQRVIRRTVNGGTTWVDQVRTPTTYGLNDVWFSGPTAGIVVGTDGNILRTTTGSGWSSVSSGTTNHLYGVSFANSTHGIIVGQSATIRLTTNGGATWTSPMYSIPTAVDLNDVAFVNTSTAYAVGVAGTIIKFDGVNWTLQTSGTTNDLNGVYFVDVNIGYAVGTSGTILKTINGGADWNLFPTSVGNTDNFYSVHFPTPHIGYVVGYTGVNAHIFKYQSVPEPTGQPSGLVFSAKTSTGQTLTFSPATGTPNGYIVLRKAVSPPTSTPLDGVGYTIGSSIGDGVVAYFGNSLSFIDTSLTPGTNYHYRIYSYNSSGTDASINYYTPSPLFGNSVTTLSPPVSNTPTSVVSTGFTANWTAVSGASSYRLDVSADGFTTLVSGYNNLTVSGITSIVTGLNPGTSYSYRVRSVNVSGSSANSNTTNTITLPSAPVPSVATLATTTSFTANWTAAVSAVGYFLDVSTNNFTTFVSGYNNLSLPTTTQSITGLTAGTTYQYRIRATNASGVSVDSSPIVVSTFCSPPTTNAASSIIATSFTANWTGATGASDYRIDVSTDPSFSFTVGSYNNLTVAGTSVVVTGLTAGTNYYYRVRASNTSGSSVNSSPISLLTLPSSPLATEATSIASTTFTTTWNPVSTATGYFIDVSTVNTFSSFVSGYNNTSVSGTSLSVTVPTAGITYYYRIRCVNATGTSSNSNTIATLLKPATPTTTTATLVSATSFTSNWGTVTGATEYALEVSTNNFASNINNYDNLTVTGTSLAVIDLTPGTTYKYRLRAVNAAGISTVSNSTTVTLISPAPIATLAASITTSGFTATWTATAGAASYLLDVSGVSDFSSFISGYNGASVASTSSSITGLSPGTTYYYRLRAVNTSGVSVNSNTITTSTLTSVPTANASTSITSTGFNASWSSVTGANDYRIDVSTSNTFSSFVGSYNNQTVGGSSTFISGLLPATTYYYRVRASNSSGSSANSGTITTLTKPAAPNAIAATSVTTTSFTANWDAVSGATSYRLDVSLNDFVSSISGYSDLTVSGTSQSVTGLVAGTTYKFRVRAINTTGASDNSNTSVTITVPPAPVASAATSMTTTGFMANWINNGATAYYLDVSIDNFVTRLSGYDNLALSGTSQSVTGLSPGTTYSFRVRAANASGTSVNSSSFIASTLPIAPTVAAASLVSSTGFTANWAAVTGAVDYRIDLSTDNSFTSFVGSSNQTVSGTSLSLSGLLSGTTYYYRVRAANSSGSSANSGTVSVLTFPSAPTANDALVVTSTTFYANWIAVPTATGYFIDVSIASNFSSFVSGYNNLNVSSTSTIITLPSAGATYYYRVRATSGAGTSSNSNTITTTLKPAAPIAGVATSINAEGFTANWSTVPSVSGYYLDVSTNNFLTFVPGYDNFLLAGISQTISGLNPGMNYQYRVRAYNSTGASVNSSTITTITIPPAPVSANASAFAPTSFTANWLPTTGASSYRLDVSSDPLFGSFITGFNNLTVSGTSSSITGLVAGTIYYYRVRAVNFSGASPNSNITSSTNIPPPPSTTSATDITVNGFTANWSTTSGALSYYLDVSATNFTSFVSGYENLNVTVNSISINGLNAGTAYQYRVRATNASGTSPNSSVISLETLPHEPSAQPTAMAFTAITTSSMNVAFTASSGGATGYLVIRKSAASPTGLPVDAVTYVQGNTLGDATVVYVGGATSFSETGLAAGTVYFYDVYAYNGSGITTNYFTTSPLENSKLTLPSAPNSLVATPIAQTTFTASWSSVQGATGYAIDVSANDFSTFVTGYNNQLTGNITTWAITGLLGATSYTFRVRAINTSGSSPNSEVVPVLTIPNTPTNLEASLITPTSFRLAWNPVAGADNFLVDLSPDNFVTFTVSNAAIPGPATFDFQGLSPFTTYKVRLRSKNATGTSPSSAPLTLSTLASGGTAVLKIETPNFNARMLASAIPVSVDVSGGVDPKMVKLKYRKIAASSFESITLALRSGSTSIYDASIVPDMADELGVEFYLEATDAVATVKESPVHYFIYRAIDAVSNQAIPFNVAGFNGKSDSYQMFSVPYTLADPSISNLFDPALNGQDATRWRLFHFQNNAYAEYPDQLKKIELGRGYWFNTTERDFQIKLSAAVVETINQSVPFTMVLEKGWNQIGNPYPFNVDWKTVKEANNAAGLNSLWLFEEGNYVKKDVLNTWKGAFVFSDNGGVVSFPLSTKTSSSGRTSTDELQPVIDEAAWQLPIGISLNGLQHVSHVGMHPEAGASKDMFDEIAMPRFINYLEAYTHHQEFFAHRFSGDVVRTTNTMSWLFTISSNQKEGEVTIHWNNQAMINSQSRLMLLDLSSQNLVDMKSTNMYHFTWKEGAQFKILYSREGELLPEVTLLGNAYPNPFNTTVTIPYMLEQDQSSLEIIVFDMLGRKVKTIAKSNVKAGLHDLDWNGRNEHDNEVEGGMYFYQLRGDKGILSPLKRLLKH